MSYRKITVDDVLYEYVIGKDRVKIKGLGEWKKSEIGEKKLIVCDCGCARPIWELLGNEGPSKGSYKYNVTPAAIATKIKECVGD